MTDKTDNKELRELEEMVERGKLTKINWTIDKGGTKFIEKAIAQARQEGREQGQTEFAQSQADTIVALMKDSIHQEERERCVAALENSTINTEKFEWKTSKMYQGGYRKAIDVIKELK
jgi:transcriptional regulator with GAF, ATPase, and Fis domain